VPADAPPDPDIDAPPVAAEPSTTAKGRSAEERAEAFLLRLGYEIVERNARSALGEIDLVAREGGDLVFVEVRSRGDDSTGGAEETVGAIKQRQLARAASAYLAERSPGFDTCRFDVVAITGDDIALFQDAFRLPGDAAGRY
jgi:putative endonuclease